MTEKEQAAKPARNGAGPQNSGRTEPAPADDRGPEQAPEPAAATEPGVRTAAPESPAELSAEPSREPPAPAEAPEPADAGPAAPTAETAQAAEAGEAAEAAAPEEPSAEAQLAAAEQEAAEHLDKYMRLQAEFENYKRRMHKEQIEVQKYAQLPLLRDLTGVMDNLERAVEHSNHSENPDHQVFTQGLEMVIKQIDDIFERFGMYPIAAKGEPFDPTKHEAMNLVETVAFPENTVIEELQTGYSLHDRIVRPSMVTVSKKPEPPPSEKPGNGENTEEQA